MDNERHIVYQSLIRKPKLVGLSHGLFGMLAGSCIVFLLIVGVSWAGIGSCIAFGFGFHHFLLNAEDNDELFLLLWIGKIFKGDNHYKARGPIDHTPGNKTKSIPTLQ